MRWKSGRRSAALFALALGLSACSSLGNGDANALGPGGADATTAAPSTTASITSEPPSTTAATSTTSVPTTAVPTTAVPITEPESEETGAAGSLPRTGPTEAAIFTAVGCAMVLVGRTSLDALGLLGRLRFSRTPAGRPLPPR